LIEVLASVFLTSIVLGIAVSFYIEISHASEAAAAKLRGQLHAVAILDRVAQDLESAYLLVKPPDTDPLYHPWLFLAESRIASEGADRVKFITRNHRPRVTESRESDLAMVAYMLQTTEDDTFELVRWVSPHIPDQLDREFPEGSEDVMVLAEGLDHFALLFMTESGEWVTEWDSSTVESTSQLPLAVEIQVRMAPKRGDGELAELDLDQEPPLIRQVLLPVRPIDLTGDLGSSRAGDPDYTIGQCLSERPNALRGALFEEGLPHIGGVGSWMDWATKNRDMRMSEVEYDSVRRACGS
jgi:type II secretory pathway component PulJ